MKSQRQGLWSTKPTEEPKEVIPQIKRNEMMMKVVDLKETLYTDQTGKFPYLSNKGMRYVMVAYHSNTNYIFVETMKNQREDQMILTYEEIFEQMKEAKLGIKKHILDNKISEELKKAI